MDSPAKPLLSLQFKPGDIIAGRYEICERLGAGGMGLVYRVVDRELDNQLVALKLLHSHLAQDETVFRRFRNEVLVARSLSHPNIVRTHDIGRADDGVSYISMEFIDGLSLKEYLTKTDTTGEHPEEVKIALPFEQAVLIFFQILSGMAYAHGKGVIHRDLKPANVLINKSGEVKLADFGTARIVGMDTSITRTGQVIGTPDYMSPEQIRGEKLDPSCDIYSLALIGFELITGRRPFIADSPVAIAYKHLNEPLPELECPHNDVPDWFKDVITRAASKKKGERYATAGEMAHAVFECMPELSKQTGFFTAESGKWLAARNGAAAPPTVETQPTAVADAPTVTQQKSSDTATKTTTKVTATEWTLDFTPEEPMTLGTAPAEPTAAQPHELPARRSGLMRSVVPAVCVLLALLALPRLSSGIHDALQGVLFTDGQAGGSAQRLAATVFGIQAPGSQSVRAAAGSIETAEDDANRLALRQELLGLSEPGESETRESEPGKIAPPPSSTGASDAHTTKAASPPAIKSAEPPPPPKEQPQAQKVVEPSAPLSGAASGAPSGAKSDGTTPVQSAALQSKGAPQEAQAPKEAQSAEEPVEKALPVEPPKPVSGSLLLQRGGSTLADPSLSLDGLNAVRWDATIENVPGDARDRQLADKATLNVFETASERVITRIKPKRIDTSGSSAKISGTLEPLNSLRPRAGSYRLDLVFNGEVLASQSMALYVAQVSYSGNGSRAETNGRVNIVRGPAVIDPEAAAREMEAKEASRIELARRAAEQRLAEAKTSPPAPPPEAPRELVNSYNLPSTAGLPPAKGFENRETAPQPPPAAVVPREAAPEGMAGMQPPTESSPPPLQPQAERFSGSLKLSPTESRTLTLELRFNGDNIEGTATLAGYSNPFEVRGQVYPRGLEIELSNPEAQLRLTAVRRSQLLRGTYIFAGTQQRGSFQARQR